MRLSKTLIILAFFCLLSCKKEVIEKQETIIEKTVYVPVGSFELDTFVGTPNTWLIWHKNEHRKTIKHDSIKADRVVDVFIGHKGGFWLNLPYVNVQDNVAINYFWDNGFVTLMGYGDSANLKSISYWHQFSSYIKIRIARKP